MEIHKKVGINLYLIIYLKVTINDINHKGMDRNIIDQIMLIYVIYKYFFKIICLM